MTGNIIGLFAHHRRIIILAFRASLFGSARPAAALLSRGLAVLGELGVDEGDGLVDDGVAQALLGPDRLYEAVDALDVRGAGKERAGGRGGARQPLRRGGVLLEGHEVRRRRAELDAKLAHPVVNLTGLLDIRV